jgi:FKBP-type peptidyl-prolyl cis-trans isomerase
LCSTSTASTKTNNLLIALTAEELCTPVFANIKLYVTKKIAKGVDLLDEIIGVGTAAQTGSVVTYNARIFLRRGEEVTRDAEVLSRAKGHLRTREIDGVELIDHLTELGKRRVIAGIEKALYGMRKNGYREVQVSPHLAYGRNGVADLIPANAVLRIQLWVREVYQST